jgi:hypothetical protein
VFYDPRRIEAYVRLQAAAGPAAAITWVVYDFLPLLQPDGFPPGTARTCAGLLAALRTAPRTVFISERTRSDFLDRVIRPARPDAAGPACALGGDGLGLGRADFGAGRREFLHVGTIEPRKNVGAILEAFEAHWRDGGQARLTLIGRLREDCTRERAALARLAGEPRLSWLGAADDAAVRAAYGRSRATLFVSSGEGFGLPPYESLAAGVPVIALAELPSLEMLGDRRGWLAIDAPTPDAIRAAVERLTDDDTAARLWAEAATVTVPGWDGFVATVAAVACPPPGADWPKTRHGERPMTRPEQPDATRLAVDVNHLLHDARSAMLRRLPPPGPVVLSAGCAGTWYFDWIAAKCGPVARHIGIEYYMPRPADLPAGVEWIANTAGDMGDVADGTANTVLSGQNLEHLWPEEVAGFLCESWRVLIPGGRLVIDSPNRLITTALGWSHPEHTVELTPGEAAALCRLAGFETTVVRGLWLCRDPADGRMLGFEPVPASPGWSTAERLLLAEDRPDDSFIWWIEARRTDTPPDRAALDAALGAIFAEAWAERTTRFVSLVGEREPDGARRVPQGTGGVVFFGPYMPIWAGSHAAVFEIAVDPDVPDDRAVAGVDVMGPGDAIAVRRDLTAGDIRAAGGKVTLGFELGALAFGMQARVIATGAASLTCQRPRFVLGPR